MTLLWEIYHSSVNCANNLNKTGKHYNNLQKGNTNNVNYSAKTAPINGVPYLNLEKDCLTSWSKLRRNTEERLDVQLEIWNFLWTFVPCEESDAASYIEDGDHPPPPLIAVML